MGENYKKSSRENCKTSEMSACSIYILQIQSVNAKIFIENTLLLMVLQGHVYFDSAKRDNSSFVFKFAHSWNPVNAHKLTHTLFLILVLLFTLVGVHHCTIFHTQCDVE